MIYGGFYMSKIICIDAGHGGIDNGAINGLRFEKDDVFYLAENVKKLLLEHGFYVIMTRTDDSYIELCDRTNIANQCNADLFISFHRNSYSDSYKKGVEIWLYTLACSSSKKFANILLKNISDVGITENRGVNLGNYHICREAKMPSIILELGFITNSKDNLLFDKNFEGYTIAIVASIMQYFNIDSTNLNKKLICDNQKENKHYKVQVGSFRNRANADRMFYDLKSKGYNPTIVN